MRDYWYIHRADGITVAICWNDDMSWSKCVSNKSKVFDCIDNLTYAQAVQMALNDILTRDDITKFYVDKLTEHLKQLFSRFPHPFRFQILWTFDGEKPLIVEVTEASVPTDAKSQ